MNGLTRYLPFAIVAVAALYLLMKVIPPSERPQEPQIYTFGKLPVVHNGRIKPFDSLARTSLMTISGRQEFEDLSGNRQPAIKWLLDVMTSNDVLTGSPNPESPARQYRVFRIENDEVLAILGLDPKRPSFRYSFAEIEPKLLEFKELVDRAGRKPARDHDLLDKKIIETGQKIALYWDLSVWLIPHAVPPQSIGNDWMRLAEATYRMKHSKEENESALQLLKVLYFYERSEAAKFNAALADYQKYLQREQPEPVEKASFEAFFNNFEPFFQCMILCLFVFILACLSWLVLPQPLQQSAFWLGVLILIVHTWALIARMQISGRPPVTNLYSSAVFIGWGCVFLSLILEWIFRNSLGSVVAAVTGGLTLFIAHHLGNSGDTLEVMQAVLDTNFWLATHVVIITKGYTATFVAGFLGILFVLLGVATRWLTQDLMKLLGQMIYGTVCFATLLSFTGTVLGGIWADQSWGRFWGWDPKENGALLIVLWNALILHARWAGMIKQRGLALLAIFGNIVTAWSWFGVNMLGVGLHSYGFMSGALFWLLAFVASQLLLIGVGMMPMRLWASYQPPRPVLSAASAVVPTDKVADKTQKRTLSKAKASTAVTRR